MTISCIPVKMGEFIAKTETQNINFDNKDDSEKVIGKNLNYATCY
jgi:hypothetical protein